MATIVNTAPTETDSGNGGNSVALIGVGIILLAFLFFAGMYMLRPTAPAAAPQTQQAPQQQAPQVKIPDKIDVNIQQPAK